MYDHIILHQHGTCETRGSNTAPSRAQSSLPSRRDGSPHAGIVSPCEGSVQPTELVRSQAGPCSCHPLPEQNLTHAGTHDTLRGYSQGQDRPCTHKATLSNICLESFLGPFGPSLRANTRAIQARSYPQWLRSQWDHSCPQNPMHTRVVPLAVAWSGPAMHSQLLSLQHSHCSTSVSSTALG